MAISSSARATPALRPSGLRAPIPRVPMPRDPPRRPKELLALPRWPLTAMFVWFPLWWLLGLAETAWIPFAVCMIVLMVRRGGIRVPRGFGLWALFLLLMMCSVIGIDSSGRMIGFVYRALLYLTVTATFVYVYNARERLTTRYVLGVITLFWVYAWVGGLAGVIAPEFSFRTPLGYVLPAGLQSNELVGEMVTRRLTQYNPDSWLALEPRPAAPFLYTNTWGNVYSLTLPAVVAYLGLIPRGRRFWLVVLAIPVSFIPAILTLNRGMLLGLGVSAVYLLLRLVVAGRTRAAIALGAVGVVAGVAMTALDVLDRLTSRVETSSSTQDRANLYQETFERTLRSPFFGYGAPRPSTIDGAPSAGTQGHVWAVMFSYGFPALACFLLALIWLFVATFRARSVTALVLHALQLVVLVESFFYGVLPNGLMLSFIAAALVLRDRDPRLRESP